MSDTHEQRKHPRHVWVLAATWDTDAAKIYSPGWPARIVNLSRSGVALHVGERLEKDTVLTIRIFNKNEEVGPVKARIVHVKEQPNKTRVIGTEFLQPLSHEELQVLLS